MTIHDIRDHSGHVVQFEVGNLLLSRMGLVRLLRSVEGVVVVWSRWTKDEFCEFTIDGVIFRAVEPFGDNSRYLLTPIGDDPRRTVLRLRDGLAARRPSRLVKVLAIVGGATLTVGLGIGSSPAPLRPIAVLVAATGAFVGAVSFLMLRAGETIAWTSAKQ